MCTFCHLLDGRRDIPITQGVAPCCTVVADVTELHAVGSLARRLNRDHAHPCTGRVQAASLLCTGSRVSWVAPKYKAAELHLSTRPLNCTQCWL